MPRSCDGILMSRAIGVPKVRIASRFQIYQEMECTSEDLPKSGQLDWNHTIEDDLDRGRSLLLKRAHT